MNYPVISLVGRPNVGKSTLFNRLSNSRRALVSDFEGLTRDRQYATVQLNDETKCSIIDTGGLTNEDSLIDTGIHEQVLSALDESDVIFFIVSNKDGVTSLDLDMIIADTNLEHSPGFPTAKGISVVSNNISLFA